MSDYQTAQTFLLGLKAHGVSLGLERMQRLMAAFGDPQDAVPCIHLAGTNGKGSVAAMLEAVLRAAGWRTGLYTSPHLVRLGERVQVDRRALTDGEIAGYVGELQPHAAGVAPSYFEFMTAMAFLHFARRRCDIAVIEVGLGGRLDATNVVAPEVSVITSIGLDHCEILGDTLAAIATEKAGIIKPDCPVVIGRLPSEAEQAVRSVAALRETRVVSVKEEFGDDLARCPRTSLAGDYQRWNAATATLAARALPARWNLSDAAIAQGLLHVNWAGRWQRLEVGGRILILDTSHNAEGAQVLDVNLAQLAAETARAPIVVVGVLGSARAKPILEAICRHAREIHLVVPDQSRACSHIELAALVPAAFRGRVVCGSVNELFPAAGICVAGEPGDSIVVTGSVYLVGEVMARVDPRSGLAESRMQDF